MYYSSQQYAWLRSLALYLGLVAVVMQAGNGNIYSLGCSSHYCKFPYCITLATNS